MKSVWRKHLLICLVLGLLAVPIYFLDRALLAAEPQKESPSDTELFRTLEVLMRRSEPGSVVGPIVSAGTSDSRYFRARGIVAYGIAPFKVNYYDADTVHANDERIRQRFFGEGVRLMRTIVTGFCAR